MTTDPQFSYVARNHDKPRRTGKTPEAKVTKAIDDYLTWLGCIAIRTNAGAWKDENGHTITGAKAGTSDKTLCLPGGLFAALEIKAGTNTLSDAQKAYKARVEALGGIFIEAHSVAEARAGLCAAVGAAKVAEWEQAAASRADAKATRREALMRKNGQVKG
jgi:hypothetical protein